MKSQLNRILMVVDKDFLSDTRVRSEAFKLAGLGYGVRVISLSSKEKMSRKIINKIPVYLMPLLDLFKKSTRRNSRAAVLFNRMLSAFGYVIEYSYFVMLCCFLFPFVALKDGFDVIQIHNPPNILCLFSLAFKLLGKKIVFDHHDLEPELFLSRYQVRKNILYKILVEIEALIIRYADMVIATNESYKKIEIRRGRVRSEKIFVVRNGPNLEEMARESAGVLPVASSHPLLVYVGVMGPQDGVDYLLRALHQLRYGQGREDFRCVIVGPGDALKDLKAYSMELNLADRVKFTGSISKRDLLSYIASADICLDPNPSSPLNDHSTWIKVMEYMAFGKPTVSFDLKETRYTAGDAAVYAAPNDVNEYARMIAALIDDPARRREMGEKGRARIMNDLAWEIVSENLARAYEWLFSRQDLAWTRRICHIVMRRFYYLVKSILPRNVQIAIRRRYVHKIARNVDGKWPISTIAGRKPCGWRGWPHDHRFAFVLSHDVESKRGLDRCLRLAEIEKGLGLVSSYNFVPEGGAQSLDVRNELLTSGFEIGVHDFKHDGKLFKSERAFSSRLGMINGYLRAWNAVGFRSGSMFHNLGWMHRMEIEYDSSTFDTDPFEPQPDGIHTVFPVWISNELQNGGYVELAYTLPQDMTLFVLLEHQDTHLWEEKLDWVAQKGGMVFFISHPDYMCWSGETQKIDEYPVELYCGFLEFVKKKYPGEYWNALPREVARYWKNCMAKQSNGNL